MAVNHRKSRVADGVRDEIAMILSREIRDPRLGFVTVIRVDMPPDQSVAKVHVSPMGDAKAQAESMKALIASRAFVRRLLAQRMKTRTVPEIFFVQDKGLENAERVGALMAEWKAEEEASRREAEARAVAEGSQGAAGSDRDEDAP